MPGAPKTLDPDSLAHPKETGSGVARAYAASKLCDLLMARSFAVLDYVKQRHIGVIAYNPGLTGGTSLGGQSALKDFIMTALRLPLRFMSLFLPQLYMHTPEQSGEALAERRGARPIVARKRDHGWSPDWIDRKERRITCVMASRFAHLSDQPWLEI